MGILHASAAPGGGGGGDLPPSDTVLRESKRNPNTKLTKFSC